MRLVKWGRKSSAGGAGYMLQVSRDEALKLIRSLSSQLIDRDPNAGRWETFLESGEQFSVAAAFIGASMSQDSRRRSCP